MAGEMFHFLDTAEWVAFYYDAKLRWAIVFNCNTPLYYDEFHFSILYVDKSENGLSVTTD